MENDIEPGAVLLKEWIGAERGRLTTLANTLGISKPTLSAWKRVPAEHCLTVEQETGITRYVLRPDVYGLTASSHGY